LTQPSPDGGIVVRRAGRADPQHDVLLQGAAEEPVYAYVLGRLQERGLAGEVWAVDLSGQPRVFGYEDVPTVRIGFRPMTRADLPDVVAWQKQPHVARWWNNENPDVAAAERNYGPALDGEDPTRMWVIELNGCSVGTVQDYRIGDHPEYALLTAEPDAVGFDYLIGPPAWVGKGIGTRMLWRFLCDVVRPHYPDAPTYFAAPDHRNTVSLRVLDKLGFDRGLWFDEPQPGGRVDTVVSCKLDVRRTFG
jgi:aminoglycoside 6'-N-acetyltransferase